MVLPLWVAYGGLALGVAGAYQNERGYRAQQAAAEQQRRAIKADAARTAKGLRVQADFIEGQSVLNYRQAGVAERQIMSEGKIAAGLIKRHYAGAGVRTTNGVAANLINAQQAQTDIRINNNRTAAGVELWIAQTQARINRVDADEIDRQNGIEPPEPPKGPVEEALEAVDDAADAVDDVVAPVVAVADDVNYVTQSVAKGVSDTWKALTSW